jgi:hypothetical protein
MRCREASMFTSPITDFLKDATIIPEVSIAMLKIGATHSIETSLCSGGPDYPVSEIERGSREVIDTISHSSGGVSGSGSDSGGGCGIGTGTVLHFSRG